MSNTEEIRVLMADRVAWDAKVQRVVEATRQRTVRPQGTWDRIRTNRKRVISQAARRMRMGNAHKYIDQLICAAPTCHVQACSDHCTLCRHSLAVDAHDGSPILKCKYDASLLLCALGLAPLKRPPYVTRLFGKIAPFFSLTCSRIGTIHTTDSPIPGTRIFVLVSHADDKTEN
ncbi:hypothetical protein DIPPA_10421 [Diplonema papillatum]|nr:hypothetical protein DIPPA_10421 [Diplonema papillatum]